MVGLAACGDDDSVATDTDGAPVEEIDRAGAEGAEGEDSDMTTPTSDDQAEPTEGEPTGDDEAQTDGSAREPEGPIDPTDPTLFVTTEPAAAPPVLNDVPADPGATSVERASRDLAGRLGVDVAAVRLVSERNVTWPDGAIGCPQKGMSYTQAVVDGVQIILEVDGQEYRYHGGGARDLFYCSAGQAPVEDALDPGSFDE